MADAEAIADIYNYYVAKTIMTFEEEAVPPSEIAQRINMVRSASLPWLVAEVGGQIAGYVARRIVCYVKPGQAVAAGERFGQIRFGSRTDLYLPEGARLLVSPGQRMIGGETVMAEFDPVVTAPRLAVEF